MTSNQQAAREWLNKLVDIAAADYRTEHEKAMLDAAMYGMGFVVDGKRVPPGLIQIIPATPVSGEP